MNTLQLTGTTATDGTLTLRLALGQPATEYDVLVVAQPRPHAAGSTQKESAPDQWAHADAILARLTATGRNFGDSVQDIREDRER